MAGAIEAADEEVGEAVAPTGHRRKNPRRKIFSIWRNTWTRRSASNSTEVAKVCARAFGINLLRFWVVTNGLLAVLLSVTGTLKGYDQLMNLVLDDVKELTRGMSVICSHAASCYTVLCSKFPIAARRAQFSLTITTRAHGCADDEGNESSRPLGLIVARGTLLVLISPLDGSEQIENPFTVAEE